MSSDEEEEDAFSYLDPDKAGDWENPFLLNEARAAAAQNAELQSQEWITVSHNLPGFFSEICEGTSLPMCLNETRAMKP